MIELTPAMLSSCAATVAPQTIMAIVRVESGGRPLLLGVNRPGQAPLTVAPQTEREAIDSARKFVAAGYSVDLGLMQINSRNLERLGLTIDRIFDPCTNLGAGARILTENFVNATKRYAHPASALGAALSAYNTGSNTAGFTNGYVAKVTGQGNAYPTTTSPYTAETAVFSRQP